MPIDELMNSFYFIIEIAERSDINNSSFDILRFVNRPGGISYGPFLHHEVSEEVSAIKNFNLLFSVYPGTFGG